jgi:hypothetical protein
VIDELLALGHVDAWTVGGESRHPSRWHQYVSDKHARAGSGEFAERLKSVLVLTDLLSLRHPVVPSEQDRA